MSKKENEYSGFKVGFVILFILIFFSLSYLFSSWLAGDKKNDCFEKIARETCNERDLFYYDYSFNGFERAISCMKDPRGIQFEKFRFLDNEIERCLK